MGLFNLFKTLKRVKEIKDFIKENEDLAERAASVIRTTRKCIAYLRTHKDDIQTYIDKAEKVVNKLEKVLDK